MFEHPLIFNVFLFSRNQSIIFAIVSELKLAEGDNISHSIPGLDSTVFLRSTCTGTSFLFVFFPKKFLNTVHYTPNIGYLHIILFFLNFNNDSKPYSYLSYSYWIPTYYLLFPFNSLHFLQEELVSTCAQDGMFQSSKWKARPIALPLSESGSQLEVEILYLRFVACT